MWDAIVIILDIVVIVGALYNHYRSESLDEREEELDKYSVHLDERANELAKWERELNGPLLVVRPKTMEDQCISASYCISDSDLMKYSTDRAVRANAKNRIAMAIAHDIVKNLEPNEEIAENGNAKLTYKLKITKL